MTNLVKLTLRSSSARVTYSKLTRRCLVGGTSFATSDANAQYCLDIVHKQDYESYLIGLLMPKNQRRAYYAIRSFNVELATIKDQVPRSAQHAGRIRFQFWRDLLQQMDAGLSLSRHINHPIALELHQAILEHKLTIRWLERCIEARCGGISWCMNLPSYCSC
jgi:phytoene/squalene synthetase